MTTPLSPEAVAQMVADREIGTKGPWTFEIDEDTQQPRLYGDGSLIAVFGNHMTMCDAAWIPEADARRATRLPDLEAAYLTLAAENATMRAERDSARDGCTAVIEARDMMGRFWATARAELATLRASEAAALERATVALEIAQTRHIPDQPAAYGGSELEWAQRQYASLRRDIIAALTEGNIK